MAIADPKPGRRTKYFSLWTLTEHGATHPDEVKKTIDAASAMIKDVGAECHLYVTTGGACDFIGVAKGDSLDDAKIVEIQFAIRSFGTMTTVFIKGDEYSLREFGTFVERIDKFRKSKP